MKKLIAAIKHWFYPYTMRERCSFFAFLFILGLVLWAMGLIVHTVFFWIAGIYYFILLFLHLLAMRCRYCDAYIGSSYNIKTQHCPYCGQSID